MPSPAEVVEQIDAFLARHDMAPTRFGRDALGEPQFVSSLKAGRVPGLGVLARLSLFMRERDAELAMTADNGSAQPRRHRLSAGAR